MLDSKAEILSKLNFRSFFESQIENLGKANRSHWAKCLCIFHEEQEPSLSVNLKNGSFKCHGCGEKGSVFDFYMKKHGVDFNTALQDLAKIAGISTGNQKRTRNLMKGRLEATYDYRNEKGEIQFQVCRFTPKGFKQRRPKPGKEGEWIWNMKGVPLIPYNLPEVCKADSVFLVEGEKDVESLRTIGLTASCNPMGAGKWRKEFNRFFKEKKVIVIPDNDAPGLKHAMAVATSLHGIAKSTKVVRLSGLQEKGDASDWIADGHSRNELIEIVQKTCEWSSEENQTALEPHIVELNKRHAVVMLGGRCVVMNEIVDPTFKRPDVTFSSVNDFRNFYANKKIANPNKGRPKEISMATDWMNSPGRRQYEGVVFSPGEDVEGFYNLYRGLACKPKKGKWNLFRDHIRNIICCGDKSLFKWVLAWVARIFKEPGGRRPGTSIVLRGKQGSGKGCFVSQIGTIIGSHFLHITSQKQLTGRFNNHLKDALVVYCDEATWGGDKTAEGILKGIVTEKHVMVEPKGKDAFAVKNHINLLIASNNNWVVPAGLEERRFCVIDVSEDRLQDRRYFKAIFDQMDNGGREAMLYDFLKWDISSVDLQTIPRTAGLFDQILSSMTTVQKFWFERLKDGIIPAHSDDWSKFAETKRLYNDYINFANNIGDRYNLSPTPFTKELKKLSPGITRRRLSSGEPRPWAHFFPPLGVCREQFEKAVRMAIKWESDDDEAPF